MNFRFWPLLALALFAGCRDLSIPLKQEGRVTGVAVYTEANGQLQPAAGAIVSVPGTSLTSTATSEGAFSLRPKQ